MGEYRARAAEELVMGMDGQGLTVFKDHGIGSLMGYCETCGWGRRAHIRTRDGRRVCPVNIAGYDAGGDPVGQGAEASTSAVPERGGGDG